MLAADYLVVGSGLTGAVIARLLADAGREVLVLERRGHMGGNVHDQAHASGIRIHTYGPHYFRTASERIWEFATRFASFHPYEASLVAFVDGNYENWPIAGSYIRQRCGAGWAPEFVGKPRHFEEAALALMPRLVYEKFVKEYNEKQWGVPAHALAAELCQRFDVRGDDEPRLKPHCKFQGIPECGYAEWMRRMLAGIPVVLDFDYIKRRDRVRARKALVFTGPIDEFFGFDLGKLSYRGQRREHVYLEDVDWAQPRGQVNYPAHADGPHIRTLEWKHMMPARYAQRIRGTVLTREVPYSPTNPSEYEYPFPDRGNAELYEAYRARAAGLKNVLICGRLGEYRYFDMDQAVGRALTLAESLVPRHHAVRPPRAPSLAAPSTFSGSAFST
jgi:UDP-galactopyranose mutase